MYKPGDRVVHPNHGAGIVKELRADRADEIEGVDQFYVVELYANRLTVMVPVKNADNLGLREANEELVNKAVEALLEEPCNLPSEFKTRQKELTDKLRSGNTLLIAEVCRDLTWRSKDGQLTSTDSRLLDQARNFVATELAAVRDCEPEQAFAQLESLLSQGIANWTELQKGKTVEIE